MLKLKALHYYKKRTIFSHIFSLVYKMVLLLLKGVNLCFIKNLGLKPRRSRTALYGKILVVTDPPRRWRHKA
jgi:hypothetical protein